MDGLKEILAAFEARVRSKVVGSILLAFVATNWKALFYVVFERVSSEKKFLFFDENTSFLSLIVVPVFVGAILALVLPWINLFGMKWTFLADHRQRQFKNNFQHLDVLDKIEYDTKIQEFKARKQRAIVDSAKASEDAKSIEDPDVRRKVEEDLVVLDGKINSAELTELSPDERKNLQFKGVDIGDFELKSLDDLQMQAIHLDERLEALKQNWFNLRGLLEKLNEENSYSEEAYSKKLDVLRGDGKSLDDVGLKILRAKEIEEVSEKREKIVHDITSIEEDAEFIRGYKDSLARFLNKKYNL